MHCTCNNSFERRDLSTSGCAVSEKNSRSSPRSLLQSSKSSPGRLLTKACPCCVESSPIVRKRLADHFSDDAESAAVDCKRMRRSLDAGRSLSRSSRARVTQVTELHDSASEIHTTPVSPSRSNTTSEVVKRGRGRPRKVSYLHSLHNVLHGCFTTTTTTLHQFNGLFPGQPG